MTRPFDWTPLASQDPTPGSPQDIEDGQTYYDSIADAAERAYQALGTVATAANMDSDAVRALHDRAVELREDIEKVDERYRETARALGNYADELRAAQVAADGALAEAQAAQSARETAADNRRYYARMVDHYANAGDSEQAVRYSGLVQESQRIMNSKDAEINRLRTDDLAAAIQRRDDAADAAIAAIDRATDDGLNDGWWENWGADIVSIISNVAGTIAAIAGIAALVLCWVPVLGQALAAVALIAGGVALIADVALAATGEKGWGDAIIGGLGIATFGVGRAAGALLKTSQAARVADITSDTARVIKTTAQASAQSGSTAIRAGVGVNRVSTGTSNLASTFTRPNVVSALKDPMQVGSEALNIFKPSSYTHFGQGWANISTGTAGQRFTHLLLGDDAARSFASVNSARAARATAMANAGLPAPNSFAYYAGATDGVSSVLYYGSGSFDAIADAGGELVTMSVLGGGFAYDAYSTVTGGSPLPLSFDEGSGLGAWFTGEEDERSAPYRLGLR